MRQGAPHALQIAECLRETMPNRVLVRPQFLLSKSSNCAILNRSQRSERGSLCVCQALHPADIEALVRLVTPQCAPKLAALQIPHLDRAIIPATDQALAIWAALERLDRPLMGLAHPHTLPTLQVPVLAT